MVSEESLDKTYEEVAYSMEMRQKGIYKYKLILEMVQEILRKFIADENEPNVKEIILNVEKGSVERNGEKQMLLKPFWKYLNPEEKAYFEQLLEKYCLIERPREKKSETEKVKPHKIKDKKWKLSLRMPLK